MMWRNLWLQLGWPVDPQPQGRSTIAHFQCQKTALFKSVTAAC